MQLQPGSRPRPQRSSAITEILAKAKAADDSMRRDFEARFQERRKGASAPWKTRSRGRRR
jgi:hypothetical protein